MHKSLNSYPFPPYIRYKLNSCGYTDVEDIRSCTVEELCHETDLQQEEVLDILKTVTSESENESRKLACLSSTAFSLLQLEGCFLTTYCHKLDEILGGGIAVRKLTEICGAPGIGKTQMGLQLCINVQLPRILGGLDGQAILIDTEGSFVVERLLGIATAVIDNISTEKKPESSLARKSKAYFSSEINSIQDRFTVDRILKNIHVYQCRDHTELLAVITILPEFLKEHPKVHLIVIDSIAFHFRYGFEGSYSLRTRMLCGMAQSLLKLASEHNLAVILTNQMTTKITEENESYLIPSLGESWGHACTVRIVLFWEEHKRKALLFKSPWKQEAIVSFQITAGGIRDDDAEQKRNLPSSFNTALPLPKKSR